MIKGVNYVHNLFSFFVSIILLKQVNKYCYYNQNYLDKLDAKQRNILKP